MLLWLFFAIICWSDTCIAQINITFNQGKAAYFDAGQLHLISESVKDQSKQDVLYSHLLAELAANAKVRRSSIVDWYKNYEDVLSNIAWIRTSSKPFTSYTPTTDRISLKSVITTSLINHISPELQNILNRAFDTIQQLGPTNPSIDQFTKDVHDNNVYNFQVKVVNENNDQITVFQLYITLTTLESSGDDVFLLHEYNKNAITIQTAYEIITLNNSIYEKIRQSIIDKLGPDRITRYIHALFNDE